MPLDIKNRLRMCEEQIGYEFRDKELLKSALTHASGAEHRLASNERLEFLGDAILGLVVCHRLFEQYPEYLEGDLTKIKSVVVSRSTCTRISRELGLEQCLIVGKGMKTEAMPNSLLSDVLESLVAAIYLDGGMKPSRDFIAQWFYREIEAAVAGELDGNYKSFLQQYSQREFRTPPIYHLLDESGPDHSKHFKVAAEIGGVTYTAAWGKNKKQAEQRAAENALCELNCDEAPHSSDKQPREG